VVLLPLWLVGIFLYGFGVANLDVKWMWRCVAPILVVGLVSSNVLGRRRHLANKDIDKASFENAIRFSDIATAILLLPMFMTNLVFAFG